MASCEASNDGSQPTATTQPQPAYAAKLQTQVLDLMKADAIPGVIVLVKSPKGDWSATFGTAEIGKTVPMKIDDYFRIGSNTKPMTVTLILQLVQEGKLSLDDPISKYRPDVPNGENITIAQLAKMRSGLYAYTSDPEFNATIDREPRKAWTPDELLAIAFKHPPDFAPGEHFEYSNTNTVLLGTVIEKLTGMSVPEAFQKRIFEPLKVTHSLFPESTDSRIPDPHPQGYQFGTNAETLDTYALPPAQLPAALDGSLKPINFTDANPSFSWTAGAAISTADDLAVFVKALADGSLLDEKTQKVRLDSVEAVSPGRPNGLGYGLGMVAFGPTIFGHDGQIPGYSSFMAADATRDTTIIVAANLAASPGNGANAATELAKLFLVELLGWTPPGAPPAATGTTTTTG
ncbi:MAG TPA: serine hydrolase domain-containing protein [Acidimicrobiales bacterium]|nr:serine hydrolase domain-containing protein [Acidimicrobiales bacterium]